MSMEIKRLGLHWFITGNEEIGIMGPYETKAEAESDRRGIMRTIRYENEPGFMTSDSFRSENLE